MIPIAKTEEGRSYRGFEQSDERSTLMQQTISFTLNGKPTSVSVDDERALLWVLRDDLGLTGTKFGCGESYCGACTVLLDDEPVRSCSVTVKDIAGKRVMTIEGLSLNGKLHPLQEAFLAHSAFQCGFCTSGMLMAATALLAANPKPTLAQVQTALSGHLCVCSALIETCNTVYNYGQGA
jgi:carbon-monoxide dehydrogenase small subunit